MLKEKAIAPDCHGVFVGGELDMSAAPELRDAIARVVKQGTRCLVVDLSEATFIDSTCIGLLVGAHNRLERARGSMTVVCANRNVRKTFEIAGLDQLVHLDDRTGEAAEATVS